ncbi:hypothetical protein IKG54_00835 [Candidatus Saccharibacteria bacterium]|nr:hypothetical protein [Candidatus Saccharibacteria bacterium]
MAKRKLNYTATFTVNPDTDLEAEFSWIEEIKPPKHYYRHRFGRYYKVRSKDADGKWGIMDADGRLLTPLAFDYVSSKIKYTHSGDKEFGYTIKCISGDDIGLFNVTVHKIMEKVHSEMEE